MKKGELAALLAPFATDVVAYVAADGSNKVAVSFNIQDMEGLKAFTQTPQAVAHIEAHGVLRPLFWHIESSAESVGTDEETGLEGVPTRTEFGLIGN